MKRTYCLTVMGLLALPSYARAQTLPTTPPSGYANAVASNPKGTVTSFTYGSNYPARIYTPPGYSTNRTYPVMYLMHGMGGSEASWQDNNLHADIQLDNLIAQGKVDPFIIVFTRNDMNNWAFGPILLNQLMPYVEENYCVSTDPNNRALGGLSMGGMLTINIGFPNPDKFHYLMPSSPAPGIQGESQLFPSSLATAQQGLRVAFFTCGSQEVGAYGCNNAETVIGYAKNHSLGSIVTEWIVQGGAHNAATWMPSFWNYAQMAHQAGFTRVSTAGRCGPGGTGGAGGGGGGSGGVAGSGGRPSADAAAGVDGSAGAGAGGRGGSGGSSAGTRGTSVGGSDGTVATGSGGTVATDSGGRAQNGSGGTARTGSGGSGTVQTGSGGSGSGGVVVTGSGGSGRGGSATVTGTGGAAAGTGGAIASDSGGTPGSGGSPTSGAGGIKGTTSTALPTSSSGCSCAIGRASLPAASTPRLMLFSLMAAFAVVAFRKGVRRGSRRG